MPESDGTATKRTCVNVSDVLINVASDRSDHQCCGSCTALAWLLVKKFDDFGGQSSRAGVQKVGK